MENSRQNGGGGGGGVYNAVTLSDRSCSVTLSQCYKKTLKYIKIVVQKIETVLNVLPQS